MSRHRSALLVVALVAVATPARAQDAKPATSFTGSLGYVGASGNTNSRR